MLRRIALVWFSLALAIVVACGHQVTPESPIDDLAGKIQIRFRTVGPMNLNLYTYAIILNTCAAGPPYAPEPDVYFTTFNNYSFGFFIGGDYGTTQPLLYQYILTPSSTNQLNPHEVVLATTINNYIQNSNGNMNEFELTFARDQLDNPLGVSQPCPNIPVSAVTPSPSAGASMTAAATAKTAASGAASPNASPSTTPTPYAAPTTQAQATWYLNFFTIDNKSKIVLDTLSPNGVDDDSFAGVSIDTQMTYPQTLSKPVGGLGVTSDPAAQIQGGEVDNYR